MLCMYVSLVSVITLGWVSVGDMGVVLMCIVMWSVICRGTFSGPY